MTVTRWWDPGSPVDLLTPGGDPHLDVANRLVALHRTGAAALLAAADTPLCDTGTVADALELVAAAAAVEIAKADVDDVVAAANAAAGWVYQTCVAKGVIPPVAAARAAKIYGVPANALGRYPQLAADPRTPEPVLTDTADRALFGWVAAATTDLDAVAKAVETPDERRAAQADQPRSRGRYASRATAAEYADAARARADRAAARGAVVLYGAKPSELRPGDELPHPRFGGVSTVKSVRPGFVGETVITWDNGQTETWRDDQPGYGNLMVTRPGAGVTESAIDGKPIAQWLADNLAGPEVAGPAKPEPSLPKTRKKIKTIRTVATIRQAGPAAGAKARGGKARGAKAKNQLGGALGTTARAKIQEARQNAARIPRDVPSPFGDYEALADAQPMHAPGVLVLPLDEYEHFRRGMARGEQPGEVIFQMGALNTYVHFSPTARVDVAGSQGHDESISHVAGEIAATPNYEGQPEPRVWELEQREEHELDVAVRAGDRGRRDRLIREFAAKRLRGVQDELGLDDRDLSVQRELGYVDYYLDASDEETPLLVWRPPTEFGDYSTHRPTKMIAEVVIEDGVGHTEQGTRYGATRNQYDPAMPLSVREDPDPVMFFDRRHGTAMLRLSAKMVEDDVAADAFRNTQAGGYRFKRGIPGFHGVDPDGKPHDPIGKAESDDRRRAAQADQPRDHGRYATRQADTDAPVTETTIDGMPIGDWLAQHLGSPDTEQVTETAPARPGAKPIGRIRNIRTIRTMAPAAGAKATGSKATMSEAVMQQAGMQLAQARQGTRGDDNELQLDDNSEYHLMPSKVFEAKVGVGADSGHAQLDWEAREWLNSSGVYDDQGVVVELFKRHMKRKSQMEGEHWHTKVHEATYDVSGTDEYGNNVGHEQAINEVARHLYDAFKRDPNLGVLEIQMRRVWAGGRQQVRVVVLGNARRLPDQTIVRRGDIDPDAPLLVTWEGRRRTLNQGWIRNDLRGHWPLPDVDLPAVQSTENTFWMTNPWVEQWVAHSPDEYLRDT